MITFAVAMSLPATTISLADRLFLSPPNGVGDPGTWREFVQKNQGAVPGL